MMDKIQSNLESVWTLLLLAAGFALGVGLFAIDQFFVGATMAALALFLLLGRSYYLNTGKPESSAFLMVGLEKVLRDRLERLIQVPELPQTISTEAKTISVEMVERVENSQDLLEYEATCRMLIGALEGAKHTELAKELKKHLEREVALVGSSPPNFDNLVSLLNPRGTLGTLLEDLKSNPSDISKIEATISALQTSRSHTSWQLRMRVVRRLNSRESFHRFCAICSVLAGALLVVIALACIFHLESPSRSIGADIANLFYAPQDTGFDGGLVPLSASIEERQSDIWNVTKGSDKFEISKGQEKVRKSSIGEVVGHINRAGTKPIEIRVSKLPVTNGFRKEIHVLKYGKDGWVLDNQTDTQSSAEAVDGQSEEDQLATLLNSFVDELEPKHPEGTGDDDESVKNMTAPKVQLILKIPSKASQDDKTLLNTQLILTPLSRLGATIISVFGVYFCVQLAIYHSKLVTFYYGRAEALLLTGHGLFGIIPEDRWEFGEIAALLSAHDIEQGQMPEFQAVAGSINSLNPQASLSAERKA